MHILLLSFCLRVLPEPATLPLCNDGWLLNLLWPSTFALERRWWFRGNNSWQFSWCSLPITLGSYLEPDEVASRPPEFNGDVAPEGRALQAIAYRQPLLTFIEDRLALVADLIVTQKGVVLLLGELA